MLLLRALSLAVCRLVTILICIFQRFKVAGGEFYVYKERAYDLNCFWLMRLDETTAS